MSDKILIVDDEKEIADLVALYLENEDYQVFKFYTAREALLCIENEALDLAVLDVMLPDMNGFQLCKMREKMGDSFENPRYIKTVWGCGYKIERT